MKLIIMIPCYNESETLGVTLKALPKKVDGIDKLEYLIVNDGSTDNTVDIAKAHNVNHIVNHTKKQGLARGFISGLNECIRLGADVIVNTDADNQYRADDIPCLIKPILEKKADIVIGVRTISEIQHFSYLKKKLQKLGSWIVRRFSKIDIPDAPSGFRAISRTAAMKLNVFNEYTYTIETIIQASQKNIAILTVPIRVNGELRPSRLVKSIYSYIKNSIITLIRMSIVYKPFSFFFSIGLWVFVVGFLIGARFLYYFITDGGYGHVQSLILASILLGFGFQSILIAFISDLLATNRKIMEDIQYRLKKIEYDN